MSTRRQPTKRVPGPVYPLNEVKSDAVRAVVGTKVAAQAADVLAVNNMEAQAYARQIVSHLTDGSYVESVELDYRPPDPPYAADVYGVNNEDGGWYVKFYRQGGKLIITSCHPPRHPLKTKIGEIVS